MKFRILVIITVLCFCSMTNAQLIPNSDTGKTQEVESAESKINQITEAAGISFKEGLYALEKNRSWARDKFDKSIEVFLTAGVDIRSNARLQSCYSQLIETVYRIEFPSNQQPQIKGLAATCGWSIDGQLADGVIAKLLQPTLIAPAGNNTINRDTIAAVIPQAGLSEQRFEPSPLDELAKLELTNEEQSVQNNFRGVRAQSGDTVAKIAARSGVSAIELAKFNGLFPDSVVPAGREIKIPAQNKNHSRQRIYSNNLSSAGAKPVQNSNGTIPIIIKYLYDTLNDPYSVKYVKWSDIAKVSLNGQECWAVVLKLRAKNVFNAYVLGEMIFYIRNNKVVQVARLS